MDVDAFKAINDTYGHHVGDRALRAIAGELQMALRPYDLCVRYAGDEFIVVLAIARGKRPRPSGWNCRSGSARLSSRSGRDASAPRVSAGVAVFPHDGSTYETLLAEADQRMYRDKAARRGSRQRVSAPSAEYARAAVFEPAASRDIILPLPDAS